MIRRSMAFFLAFILFVAGIAHAQELQMTGKQAAQQYDELVADLGTNANVSRVVFDDYPVPLDILEKLKKANPDIEFEYSISFAGKKYRSTAEKANIFAYRVTNENQFDKLYKVLVHLPNLKELTATNSTFSFDQLEKLRELLPDMHVSTNIRIGRRTIRSGLTAFSTRHALTTTSAGRYSSQDLRAVRYCDNLLALDIGHNAITDLNFLYDAPNLRILILADNQITDITPIAALHDLEYLEIFHNPISDISPLAGLENLIDLNMTFCQVEDYMPLLGLKKLDRLWIAENPFTDEDLQMLKGTLPSCTITTDCTVIGKGSVRIAPTANGWRQGHPRYLQIVRIFEKARYEEFKKK